MLSRILVEYYAFCGINNDSRILSVQNEDYLGRRRELIDDGDGDFFVCRCECVCARQYFNFPLKPIDGSVERDRQCTFGLDTEDSEPPNWRFGRALAESGRAITGTSPTLTRSTPSK